MGYAGTSGCGVSWLQCAPCPGIPDVLGETLPYNYVNIEDAPWYDQQDPTSHRFLGVNGLIVEGITDSTRTAEVTESIGDGGVVSKPRHATRRVRVEALLTAQGEDALEYGLSWLNAALIPRNCSVHGSSCGSADTKFFTACPPTREEITMPEPLWNSPVTNLATNPSMEAAGAAVEIRRNLASNPSFEVASGNVELRRNLAQSPQKSTGPTGWNLSDRWFGPGGSTGTYSNVPGTVPDAPGVSTFSRKTWTAVGAVPQDVSWGVTSGRVPVVAGETYTVSFYVRASWNTGTPANHWFDFGGWDAASGGTKVQTAVGPRLPALAAGVWTRLSYTVTVAAGVTFLEGGHTLYCDTNSAYWPIVGSTLDATGLLVEKNAGTAVGEFFDGTRPAAGDFSYAFTGTAQASPSVQYGTQTFFPFGVLGAVAAVGSGEWAASGTKSVRVIPTLASNVSYYSIGGASFGWALGKTYTVIVKSRLVAPQTGTLETRARKLMLRPGGGQSDVFSAGMPNVAGVVEQRATVTLSATDISGAGIYLWNGAAAGGGDVWWDDLLVIEGVYTGPYFDGSTPAKVRRNLVVNPRGAGPRTGDGDVLFTLSPAQDTRTYDISYAGRNDWMRLTSTATNVNGGYRVQAPLKSLPANATTPHTVSMLVANPGATAMNIELDWCDGILTPYTIQPGETRRVSATATHVMTETYRFGDIRLLTVGSLLATDLMIEEGSVARPFFDGAHSLPLFGAGWEGTANASVSYLYDPDYTYAWTGTANASASIQRATQVAGTDQVTILAGAFRSSQWAGDRSYSIRIDPTGVYGGGTTDTFAEVAGMLPPISTLAGKLVTIRGVIRLLSPQSGTPAANARRFRVNVQRPSGGMEPVLTFTSTAPNQAGEHLVSATFTVPADATAWNFVRLMNGALADNVWWDEFMLVEGSYTGPYFDGATPDSTEAELETLGAQVKRYEWTGAADASSSTYETGSVVSVEDPVAWQSAVDALTRYMHTTTAVSGPTIVQKLHRGEVWGYVVEFVLVSAVPWTFGPTRSITTTPTVPEVVQDIPFNLVPFPSAELPGEYVVAAMNFATNPSIEASIAGWIAVSDGTKILPAQVAIAQSSDLAAVGSYSAKAVFTANTTNTAGYFGVQQEVALPGTAPTYRLSVNLWASASVQSGTAVLGNIEFHAYWQNSSSAVLRDDLIGTLPAAGGAKSMKSAQAPAGTTKVSIRAFINVTSWTTGAVIRLYADAAAVTAP